MTADPFGDGLSITGTATNNKRFVAQYFDNETAFHYNYRRDYDPVIGRYIEADPIGLAGGLDPYQSGITDRSERSEPSSARHFAREYSYSTASQRRPVPSAWVQYCRMNSWPGRSCSITRLELIMRPSTSLPKPTNGIG